MKLITLGFLLVFIGVLVIFAAMFSIAYQAWKTGETEKPAVRGGGIILIGPIPLLFGTDVGALKIVMILVIVLMAIAAFIFLLQSKML